MSEGSRGHRGGGHETAKPNHDEIDTHLGFDRNELLNGVPKLGSDVFRSGLAGFDPKLRSLTSSQISSFVGLRENRAQNTKPSLRTVRPESILLVFGVLILGFNIAVLPLGVLMLFRRSPVGPIAGLRRFGAFSTKPSKVTLNPKP